MADGSSADDRALDALTKILESAISPDSLEAQRVILRRLALAGDLFPSRVPAPLNITQVGGYLNLLAKDPAMRTQVLASTLGVAGPVPSLGWEAALPGLFFATRLNDRPAVASQPATPVYITIRNDFAAAFATAMTAIHDAGCVLPVVTPVRVLPPLGSPAPAAADLLTYLGRALEMVPSAALVDPATDPLALGQLAGAGPQQVVARQLDATAPNAASVTSQSWALWTCTAAACTQGTVSGAYLPVAAALNAAGWYQPAPTVPVSLANAGSWNRWTNLTGLIAGRTRLGDELSLLYKAGELSQSSVREQLEWMWNGTAFAAA